MTLFLASVTSAVIFTYPKTLAVPGAPTNTPGAYHTYYTAR